MKRRPPVQRQWKEARAKVDAEGRCRNCKRSSGEVRLEAAHTLGRDFDEALPCGACGGTGEGARVGTRCAACKGHGRYFYVDPAMVVPLCGPATSTGTCHGLHHARKLDLLPILTGREQLAAVAAVVRRSERLNGGNAGIAEAYRRLTNRPEPEPSEPGATVPPEVHPDQPSIYEIIDREH